MPHALVTNGSVARQHTNVFFTQKRPRVHVGKFRTISLLDFLTRPSKAAFKPSELKQIGPLKVSPMGLGTWSWGNQLLWGYDKSMDAELQQVFNLMVSKGINIFDTADSYGTPARIPTNAVSLVL